MYLIGNKKCPQCGAKCKMWKKGTNVFMCPTCSLFFNDFGIVLQPENKKDRLFA